MRARNLELCRAGWERETHCGSRQRWRYTDMRSAKILMCGKRGLNAIARWRSATLSGARHWQKQLLHGQSVRWLDWKCWSAELPAMSIKSLTLRAKRLEWSRADRLRRRLAKISRWRMCHQHWLL